MKYFNENLKFRVILLFLILFLTVILFKEARPYISGLLGACTLYVLLRQQMVKLHKEKKWKKGPAATLLIIESILFFLIPLGIITLLAINVISSIHLDIGSLTGTANEYFNKIQEFTGIKISSDNIFQYIQNTAKVVVNTLLSGSYSIIINSMVILFLLFYMLYSYEDFEQAIWELLPFHERNKGIMIEETKQIIKANAIGIPLLAIIQGIVAAIGYYIFGIDNIFIYGVFTAFSTIIPVIGTMVVWVPLSISLVLQGSWGMGIGLFAYGLLIVGSVDNIARFILQKQLADIHPLITIFGVIFGISLFGFWGIIFGPLILSLLILFINMYRYEYIPGSKALPRVTTEFKEKKMVRKFVKNDTKEK